MKLTSLSTTLFLFTTACGAVVDPTDSTDPTSIDMEAPTELGIELDPAVPPAPPVLMIEAPRAATSPGSLWKMTFDVNAPISEVLKTNARSRIDVIEQYVVTMNDQEVQLVVELPAPTGTFSRTLVSDTIQIPNPIAEHVLCKQNGIKTFDPRCRDTRPVTLVEPGTGPIATAQWKLWVVDDVTGTPVTSCTSSSATRVECVLPGRAGVAYRIVASASGFEDLWNGSEGLGQWALAGVPFTGAIAVQHDSHCWDWSYTASSEYCETRYDYTRFTAVDTASLAIDPITVEITANGQRSALASPALTWDPGNDDLPGAL